MRDDNRFVLGVDLDGVCGDYMEALRAAAADRLGVPLGDLTKDVSWGCEEWGITSMEEFNALHRFAVMERRIMAKMDTIPGVAEALWRLSDAGVWIRIITHRLYVNWGHATVAADTVDWLDRSAIPYRDLCFVAAKSSVAADAYVDDSPSQIEGFRKAGRSAIVFDQPYNRHLPGPRARNWGEVEALVGDLVVATTGCYPMQLPGSDPDVDRLGRRVAAAPASGADQESLRTA